MITNYAVVGIGYGTLPIQVAGVYLLVKARRKLNNIQFLILLGICIVEIQTTTCMPSQILFESLEMKKIAYLISIYINTGLSLEYYTVVFILTANRFSEVYLNLRYNQVWRYKRVKATMGCIIIISVIISACVMFFGTSQLLLERFCYKYYFPIFNAFLLTSIFGTYTYIYYKYCELNKTKSVIGKLTRSSFIGQTLSSATIKKRKRSYRGILMPSLFIATFVVFIAVPDTINCYLYNTRQQNESYSKYLIISYYFGFLTDVLIYTFLSPPIRDELKKILPCSLQGQKNAEVMPVDIYTLQ